MFPQPIGHEFCKPGVLRGRQPCGQFDARISVCDVRRSVTIQRTCEDDFTRQRHFCGLITGVENQFTIAGHGFSLQTVEESGQPVEIFLCPFFERMMMAL